MILDFVGEKIGDGSSGLIWVRFFKVRTLRKITPLIRKNHLKPERPNFLNKEFSLSR